ncbi:lipopolysaccharide biosynthesis protein [Oceanobacillus halophilus]|uniref:Lipopolysaccharide biosynthesis protein n=1 Tax=Oceanobacillus halophilus TaxID=930130 RepID=A0A495A4V6_9BACI|nr:oligosaccharide flippase family protein [Oceanobacillus halophilus]RKQ34299.1 lipopolysaccharide biosynthesis protein [Oceanobacillus halophilus]
MRNKMERLVKQPFIRNVFILSSGTAAAQIVTMALSPIVTRLFGPEAYGLMGTFTAIVFIITPIAALTYPMAIVLPKSDSDAKGLVKLSLAISGVITLFVALLLIIFSQQIVTLFGIEEIAPYLYLIPIVVLLAGYLQVVEQWFIRKKQFGVSAKATFTQSIIVNGGKVGFGFFHPVAGVLIIFSAISQGLMASLMLVYAKYSFRSVIAESVSVPIKELAKKYRDFPMFRAPQVFLNAVSQSLPILLLTTFFGPAAAGFYSIGRTVLGVPSQLIGKSVGDVFYPRIAEAANHKENMTQLIKKATLALGAVGILPYGLVILFGPWLYGLVFGLEWVKAGEYARWIALWIYFMFMNQPSVKALPVMSAQSFHLKFTVITLSTRTILLAIGYYVFSSDLVAIALFGVSGAILNILLIVLTIHKSKGFKPVGEE